MGRATCLQGKQVKQRVRLKTKQINPVSRTEPYPRKIHLPIMAENGH